MEAASPQKALEQAIALHKAGQFDDAECLYRQVLSIDPSHVDALSMLGLLAQQTGRNDDAILALARAVTLRPQQAEIHYNYAKVLSGAGRIDEAIGEYRHAVSIRRDFYPAHKNLGNALMSIRRLSEAESVFRTALQLQPDAPDAHFNLGVALLRQNKPGEAIASFQRAVSLRPGYVEAFNNLGIAFRQIDDLDSAIAALRQAIAQRPDYADAYTNLGSMLKDVGQIDAAIGCLRKAEALKPDPRIGSDLLVALHLDPSADASQILAAHQLWDRVYAQPLRPSIIHHANPPVPSRRLRIGYVSPGFCDGVIGRFMLPLLANHDREAHEIVCYSDAPHRDVMTDRLAQYVDLWRNTEPLSDEQLTATVRDDAIDIFVDLAMHMVRNRLLTFARQPAPVQVTYLAYCSTTGLSTMDYRLTDPHIDPPGASRSLYSEESVRLPDTYWCYAPPADVTPIATTPAVSSGSITFGCLNAYFKVNQSVLAAWASILRSVPDSRLLLHTFAGAHRQRVRDLFADASVDPARIEFISQVPLKQYFNTYHQIDIALDPFPYGGGTTTCDALWMGVPVITFAGNLGISRGGLSILSNIGLADRVANDQQAYIRAAIEFARDLPMLQSLRMTMRERMLASPLMDAPRFARSVEAAYRQMWQRWCANPSHTQ